MKKIYFATGNKGKAGEASRMLGMDLEVADLELDELQSMDLGVIVKHKVEQAYEKLKAPVIVDDVSVELEVWNGFPGPFIKFAHHAGGIPLLLYLLRNETNRNIKVICTLGYHDGEKVHIFSGIVPGIFTTEERGDKGWGLDPIILPDGQTQTFSEMDIELKNRVSHRALAFQKLKEFLEEKRFKKLYNQAMFNYKFLEENPDRLQKGADDKHVDVNVHEIRDVYLKWKGLNSRMQNLLAEKNKFSKERNIEEGKRIKGEIDNLMKELLEPDQYLLVNIDKIPALPKDDVKVGKNDTENDVIKTVGEIPQFSFKPLDHLELGTSLDIIDIERAAKVSGARYYYLKNQGAILEFALIRFAMDKLTEKGFTPIIPPTMVTRDTMKALGYMENGGEEDMFSVPSDDKFLVGTAEQSVVPMHKDETFNANELPKRYVAFSSSFRREAGSYGKDTRGILRVHEFHKVEMVSYVKDGQDDEEHEFLRGIEEELFSDLKIPYQVIKMCTGDLGFPASRKYDIEAWMPTQEKYREVTSTSTTGDFQARRLNIKYKEDPPAGGEKKYVNILNGTAFAIGRTLIAILENNQQEDGSVLMPEVLQKYTGFDKISINN